MTFFKKIKIFSEYRRFLKKNRIILESEFKIRIDRAYRIYTVINIPEELVSEPYNLRKSDIDLISQNYIKQYIKKLSDYLNSNDGIAELYHFYEPLKKVDKLSYLIVIGFKPFNSVSFTKSLYFIFLPTIIISIFSLLYFIFR